MKPFSITAPEDIAKEYGGNKKKIQQAAAQGMISPTEAVLAGMFVDRIRGAAQAEQAQQASVAEQVMNPQPQMPPQGMAATPQAQQMQQPQMQQPMAPRMGQPSMGRMPQPAPAQMPPPQQPPMQQPQGMAMGGGLDSIDFVEQSYAPGGIVSFNQGNPVTMGITDDQLRNMSRSQLRTIAGNGQIPPHIRNAAASRLQSITPAPGQQPTIGGLAAADLPRVPNVSGAMDAVGQAVAGRENVDFGNVGVSDTGVPAGEFRGVFTGMTPGEKIGALGEGIQTGFNALTSAFGSGNMDEFNRVKNAGEPVSRVEQERRDRVARVQEAQATPDFGTGRGGDPYAMGEEDRALYADRARSRIDPTGTIRPLGTRDKGLGQITSDEALAMLGETKPQVAPTGRVITDPAEIAALEANTQGPGTVADQVEQTEQAVAPPTTEPDTDAAADPFKIVDAQLADMMAKPEHGKYRKEMENLLSNREERLKDAKKEGFNMALLQAGLGMLAQGGGQTALQALGKAALPATKQYAKVVKDAKAEDRELLKLGLSMEQMDAKELAATKRTLAQIYGNRVNTITTNANRLAVAEIGAESRERVADISAKASQGVENALRSQTALTALIGQEGNIRDDQMVVREKVDYSKPGIDFREAKEAFDANPNDPAIAQRYQDALRVYNAEIARLEAAAGIPSRLAQIASQRAQLSQLGGGSIGGGNVTEYSSLAPK